MWKNRFGPVGSQGLNILLAVLAIGCVVYGGFIATGGMSMTAFLILTAIALFLGVGLVVPIGGADMPVVVSLLQLVTPALQVRFDWFRDSVAPY